MRRERERVVRSAVGPEALRRAVRTLEPGRRIIVTTRENVQLTLSRLDALEVAAKAQGYQVERVECAVRESGREERTEEETIRFLLRLRSDVDQKLVVFMESRGLSKNRAVNELLAASLAALLPAKPARLLSAKPAKGKKGSR